MMMRTTATRSRAKRFASVCFSARRSPATANAGAVALPPAVAQALADLLPLLLCGEASAELVFAGAALDIPDSVDPALRGALQRIADDERRHGLQLATLRDHLPPPSDNAAASRAAHFLRRLECRDLAVHMARVGALDAGVCHVLAEISRPGALAAWAPGLARMFLDLRRDEGRHVRVSRRCAAALGLSRVAAEAERRQVWRRFAALLVPGAAALQVLGADVERLFARLNPADPDTEFDRHGSR